MKLGPGYISGILWRSVCTISRSELHGRCIMHASSSCGGVHARTCWGHVIDVHVVSLVSIIMMIYQAFGCSNKPNSWKKLISFSNTRSEKTFTRIITIIPQSIRKQLSPAWTTIILSIIDTSGMNERRNNQAPLGLPLKLKRTSRCHSNALTVHCIGRCRPEPYWDTPLECRGRAV